MGIRFMVIGRVIEAIHLRTSVSLGRDEVVTQFLVESQENYGTELVMCIATNDIAARIKEQCGMNSLIEITGEHTDYHVEPVSQDIRYKVKVSSFSVHD